MHYDIAIVGSGIAGTALAMVLRKQGASVVVLERDQHPRFVIGESTVPASTMSWVYLAETYDLPELLTFCSYPGLKEADLTGYPKTNFYFALHREGERLDPDHQAMFETFGLGIGPDVHMLRADVDAYLVGCLPKHGVDYRDHTAVTAFEHDGEWGTLQVDAPDGPGEIRARLVFDATGHGAMFGRMLGLRHETPQLHTNTRALFGHFRGVTLLESLLPPADAFRYSRDAGTMHHCFDGGWIWVIPFDDGVVSVGILLDSDTFPLDRSVPVEAEWRAIIERFPTVAEHLGGATPIRPIVRSGRVQFSSRGITAPGVVLTPHAAAFIDPLFSTGLTQTAAFIARAAPIVAKCLADGDFDHRRFEPVERAFLKEIDVTDKIVSGAMACFDDWEAFRQSWRSWILGTNLQVFGRVVGDQGDPDGCALNFGAASAPWVKVLDARHAVAMDRRRSALERAYALEIFQAQAGSWRAHWRWAKSQWARGGASWTTMKRVTKATALRTLRPVLPVFLHAENPFVRSINAAVHSPGPISVQVCDPADTDFSRRWVRLSLWLIAAELGGKAKANIGGWIDFSRRARATTAAYDRAVAEDAPPKRAAAVRTVRQRAAGAITDLGEREPILVLDRDPHAATAPPA